MDSRWRMPDGDACACQPTSEPANQRACLQPGRVVRPHSAEALLPEQASPATIGLRRQRSCTAAMHYHNQNPWAYTPGGHSGNASGSFPGPYAVGNRSTPQEFVQRSRNSCDAPGIPPAYATGTPQEMTPQENAERLRNSARLFPGVFLGRTHEEFLGRSLGRSLWRAPGGGFAPRGRPAVAACGVWPVVGTTQFPFSRGLRFRIAAPGARDNVASYVMCDDE